MAKYAIINLEKLSRKYPQYKQSKLAKEAISLGIVLTEEESMAKFKEIWYAGVNGHAMDKTGWEYPELTERNWEEFKKEL